MKLPTKVTSNMAINIISLIKEHFGNQSLPSPTLSGNGPNERELVIKLINETIEVKDDENFEGIFLLTENNNLKLSSSLYINDVPWVEFTEEERESLVNHRITTKVSHKLGAKSKMDTLYEQEWEEFGQHEDMSKRIDNLLREFPLDVTIFKELIQNADDAEATEVVFILDSQEYGQRSLCPSDYKSNWRNLQKTPSLLVYNNKSFSLDDLIGIQAVGIGGKEGKNTIGRFGLGFNSVFHLTRCPCLLSYSENGEESVFCVFDPHKEHLNIPKGKRPGTKVTFNKQQPLSRFTYQFEPYFVEQILKKYPNVMENLREKKSFSIFRLPLNTTIDKKLDTQENVRIMRKLLEQLKNEAPRLLPFISNVKKIQIFDISCLSSCIPPIVRVIRNVEINSQLLTHRRVEVEKPIAGYSKTMQILQKSVRVDIPNSVTDTVMSSTIVKWLIYHFEGNVDMFLGRSELLQKFKPRYKIEKLRLFSSIAVELISKDNPVQSQKRYLYCHLPFGTSLNFPVHINAPFILDPHRRYVSYQDEISGSNSWDNVWHHEIMELVLAPIYFNLLYDLGPGAVHICDLTDIDYFDWYYSLFPVIHTTETGSNSMEYLQALGKSVLTLLYKSNSEVLLADDICLNGNRTWYPIHGPDAGVFRILEPELTRTMQILYECLSELKYHLTLAPNSLANSFKVCSDCASECKVVTPLDVLQYINLNISKLCKLNHEFPCSLLNCIFNFDRLVVILEFILTHFGNDPKYKEQIPTVPLKVDYANNLGWFQLLQSTFTINYAKLLPQNPERFLSKQYDIHIIKKLIEYGYVKPLTIQFLSQNMDISHQPSPEFFLLFWHFIYENVRDSKKLSQFGSFYLVPVTYGNDCPKEPTFQPINHLEYLATDEIESTLRNILFKFRCPFLYLTPYLAYNRHPPEGIEEVSSILRMLKSMAIRTIDGNAILGCISLAKNTDVVLTDMEAERLRNIFPNINYKNLSDNDWKTLSRIKMFVAEYKPGEYRLVALKDYMVCFMNNDNFPISENLIKKLQDVFKLVFLSSDITHHNPLNLITNICKRVSISCLTLNEFMESYILNIEILPRLEFETQKAIIIYLFELSGKKDNWISILKSLPFIRIQESLRSYFRPNELYCPNIPLFAAFKKDKLLPQCWSKVNVLYAKLVTLGLNTRIYLKDILDCAKLIAISDLDSLEFDSLKLPIRALINFVDSYIYMEESEEYELILQQISTLKFLPIYIRQTFIGTGNSGIRWRLGMFSEALISKHRDYCCLSSPIFDHTVSFKDPESNPSKIRFNQIMNSLGLTLIPSIDIVKLHFQNLIELCNTYTLEQVDHHLRELFFATYNYLQDFPCTLPEFKNAKCILFECKLYKPLNIVMNWRDDLSPYLFQCPHELKQFRNFLLKLKVSEYPNYEHFKFVLSSIHRENGSNQLNLENYILCTRAESAFSYLISELHSTDMQIILDGILLLTDKNEFIPYDSPHLFYGDDTQLLNRVESAHDELRILAPLVPNKFGSFAPPHRLRIKFLSHRFNQRLSPGVYELYKTENVLADNLKERLKSLEVFTGLKRIYFHDTHKNMCKVRIQNKKIYLQTEEDEYGIADGYLSIRDKIDKLDIVPVSRIDIVILDTRTQIRSTLENACICFLDEDEDTILINTDSLYRGRLPVEMTYELNQYFANVFDRSLIHLLICHVYPRADIGRALDNFKITKLPHDLAQH
ncbi:Sacsin-like [Oopsacas minuta]|uniref:Sacsin-like n=1 Tax=Oopsacas minuta TaxID=111878 RepID=A0AAV7KJ92_9METZ|nr:Sacsin-like [Oopsacas minuta]